MGVYINLKNEEKEDFLKREAKVVPIDMPWHEFKPYIPIVLIDTGHHFAAGIGFSEEEYKLLKTKDGRIKTVYMIDAAKLKDALCDEGFTAVQKMWDMKKPKLEEVEDWPFPYRCNEWE
jgi:hypothetical protein